MMGKLPTWPAGRAAVDFPPREPFARQRPTVADIDLQAVAANMRRICSRVHPAAVMAVVKADGYGHGSLPVAHAALRAGACQLGVALPEEGIVLRQHGIRVPVLVFGGLFEQQIEVFLHHDLMMTVYDFDLAQIISRRAQALGTVATVQVKIDTGMGRVGVLDDPVEFVLRLAGLPGVALAGLYTHLATSDEADKTYARQQLAAFRATVTRLRERGISPQWIHAANSGAILDLPEAYFNMVRAGVIMYGYYPSRETSEAIALQPAMRLRSQVLQVKHVPAHFPVSYGRTFQTRRPSFLATIPIGYADGFNRRFSNNMEVLVAGRRCPVVGRVCMDQIIVDLGEAADIRRGEEVVLLGPQGGDEITIYEWCERLGTIPYEVTCNISKRVPRRYTGLAEALDTPT
ncbi:MAG: alanine racemase [candidate division KSB1 bacterium]|nr:alanine racemase [candidate division KSB1 bacterium]MDZ7272606.1 alanine racemase [candidate division KSB1 bacterium]MDZ7284371.1 alanine racemase [candidate division KSB1 bacterium]MDZ7297233.1 alanine racemase [candidate division KSB1 bacterium]MDZ7308300.1 alanine racemase [candidate division KSB1 bacterium]